MTAFSFDENKITLSGVIGFQTVSDIEIKGISTIRHIDEKSLSVDLCKVTEGDSSLLAMLISWKRQADLKGIQIRYENGSEALLRLARLCGVDSILPITGKA